MIILLGAVAAFLTAAMFRSKEPMLGFPCAIMWALFGGDAYVLKASTTDIYFITFFAAMGMAIFSMYAAFALRRKDLDAPKSDWLDSGKFVDEGSPKGTLDAEESKEGGYIDDPSKPSRRSLELHNRAADRRTGGKTRTPWGE
jgi:hypothetical protein